MLESQISLRGWEGGFFSDSDNQPKVEAGVWVDALQILSSKGS